MLAARHSGMMRAGSATRLNDKYKMDQKIMKKAVVGRGRCATTSASAVKRNENASTKLAMGVACMTIVGDAGAARAGAVSDRLAAALDAADSAAESASAVFERVGAVIDQGVDLAQQAAPVVLPAAERAVKAVQPIGEAVGSYAGRALAPVADEAVKAAASAGSQAVGAADSALKAQGVDVSPALKVVGDGAEATAKVAVPLAEKAVDYLSHASGAELAQTGAELFAAYLLVPVFFKVLADIGRGYRGDLRPIEAYDMLLSGDAVIVDTRGADVTVQLPGGANRRVLVCDLGAAGGFSGAASGKVAALKIASLKGVKRNRRIILLDQGGGNKSLAKALSKQGFGKVYVVKGGFNAWRSTGLATSA